MDVIEPALRALPAPAPALQARTELVVGVHGLTLVSQGTGYGLLIGLGVLFCAVILVAVQVQRTFLAEDSNTSEMFLVANRSVGRGLTASAVFSSWMWINETVLCAALCYRYGLALPYWWACGLCFQIALMAALGVLAKIRVPYAHTSLEIVRLRYGRTGHLVFLVMNLVNNVFGCASMILTGSQLIFGISGMNFAAATVLIPLGVVLYTAVGGLKATFLTDFLHTAVALVLIIYFTLTILTHEAVGGLHGLYDKVQAVAGNADNYIESNYAGSLLTMKSRDALIWGLILKFGNLALVVMDTAFWQKSFATEVRATVPGYNLAAVAIFGIPWGLGTVVGLAARAIHDTPLFPTFPDALSLTEINAGFVMPYTVKALIGPSGIVAFFVLLFMALTSTVSSSMIAVSSILSFDLYKTYINPHASDRRLVRVSHIAVVFHAIFITGIAIALNYGGADMTWLGYFRPVIACPGIIPLALTLGWKRQTKTAAVVAPIFGFLTGLGIWLGTAYHYSGDGVINMVSTEASLPALFGAIGSFFSPLLYSVVISLWWKPYVFDWREFLRVEIKEHDELVADSSEDTSGSATPVVVSSTPTTADENENEKGAVSSTSKEKASTTLGVVSLDDIEHPFGPETLAELHRWLRIAWIFFVFVVLVTFILWPMPLYRNYIFSKTFFTSWTSVAIFWQFLAFFAVVVFPIYDGRHAIATGTRGVYHAVAAFVTRKK